MSSSAPGIDSRPLIVYWNNQPTPYVVDRFNAVVDSLPRFRFEAWFDTVREPDRSWQVDPGSWRFPARILGTTDADAPLSRIPVQLLEAMRPELLIANYDRVHMVAGLLVGRRMARRTAVRCLPTWPAWETPSLSRSVAKHVLFRAIDGAKVPGPDGAEYARSYGLPGDRMWPVTQSVDVALYARARSVSRDRRAELRSGFGASGCAFLYVGRLWNGKGIADLLEAFRRVRAENPDVSLLIAGDGQDADELKGRAAGIAGIRWVGFVQPTELPDLYAAADVLVFPTLGDPNGLVVEEAMAAGLPVISTSAAGDIRSRLPDGRAGYVVSPGAPAELAARMHELADDPDLRMRLGEEAAALAQRAAPEYYAQDFIRFADGILAKRRRPSAASLFAGVIAPAVQMLSRRRAVVPERARLVVADDVVRD